LSISLCILGDDLRVPVDIAIKFEHKFVLGPEKVRDVVPYLVLATKL